jgi:hypothetical protein
MNSNPTIRELVRTAMHVNLSYNEDAKARFHKLSRKVLTMIAHQMGLNEDQYEIRSNKAGIAVSGEITLHADDIYIQFSQSCMGPDFGFMWRTCKGRKDYTGGPNQWMKWPTLLVLDIAVQEFQRVRLGSTR